PQTPQASSGPFIGLLSWRLRLPWPTFGALVDESSDQHTGVPGDHVICVGPRAVVIKISSAALAAAFSDCFRHHHDLVSLPR
ncbi:MAG TPA: hypothetical protein PKA37_10005, partial [Planctomycetota bacterium]|nr:hypothetical protein [Planctomycetota bacterium]